MKPTKLNPAAIAAPRQSLAAARAAASSSAADRAFLADGRRFLATLRADAKAADVPLDEFLVRAGFAAEQRRRPEERHLFSAALIRAALAQDVWNGWRATEHLLSPGLDLLHYDGDGQPVRSFPATFDLAPESDHKDAARWTGPSDFLIAFRLDVKDWEHEIAWHTLIEHPCGQFMVEKIGEPPRTLGRAEWVSIGIACWYFGLSPKFIADSLKKRWLVHWPESEYVSLSAVADLLRWTAQDDPENPPRMVRLPVLGAGPAPARTKAEERAAALADIEKRISALEAA